jgi:hypothetical protein
MNIYVAGGSTELDLVASYMRKLRDLGHEITYDWVTTVREFGANPRDATHRQRTSQSGEGLTGVLNAEIVWALLPTEPSFGCAFELGFACGRGVHFIVSGDWQTSIFCAQATARFDEHERALSWICLATADRFFDPTSEMVKLEADGP